jgi:tRNA (guanine26-N2/guanine27-N2)-dimethyltransferase
MKNVKEGLAEVAVPEESLTKRSEVFYNPAMGYQRNVTIACMKAFFSGRSITVLDPLAASGVRGIRIAKEVDGAKKIVFNDLNPGAVELIKKNISLNKISKSIEIKIESQDANSLLSEGKKYDFVDIDPFGSPAKFVENTGPCLKPGSLLGVTATDTGALSGKFEEACVRRYGVAVTQTDFPKELGVRVMITHIVRVLSSSGLGFKPLYSHGNHYFRVIGSIESDPEKMVLKEIKLVSYCPSCLKRAIGKKGECECGGKMNIIGPIWTGNTSDREFCESLYHEFVSSGFGNPRELRLCLEEIEQPFYYDIHLLCRKLGKSPPPMDGLIKKVRDSGHAASRTRFCLTGLRTDCPLKELKKMV